MYTFKINLLYNEEKFSCTKTGLTNFQITLPLDKLDIVHSGLVSNDLIFSDVVPVDIQLVTFLLLFNISDLKIGERAKRLGDASSNTVKYILRNKRPYPFSDICTILFC